MKFDSEGEILEKDKLPITTEDNFKKEKKKLESKNNRKKQTDAIIKLYATMPNFLQK